MAYQRGANSGVSGLVAISGTPKFTASVYKFSQALGVQSQSRSGPGTGRWAKTRVLLPNGSLVIRGKVVLTGFPLPTDWRGQEGTIVLQQHTSVTATVSVRVTACNISLDEKSEDQWDISLTCEILGTPVLSGFTGTQPVPTDPAPTTQETWNGRQKVYDPDGIITSATQHYSIDWFNWAETDDAERQKILDIIAAATTPLPNLKVHHATINRTDKDGATATISWDLTTSSEALINANTRKTIDPAGLTSSATVAGINITGAAPTGDAFVLTGSLSYELNDQNILYVDSYGLRNSQQAIEQEGTSRADDPNSLIDDAALCSVTTSAAQPSTPTSPITGLKFHHHVPKQLNNGHWSHIFYFSRRDSVDDIQMEGSFVDFDPNLLGGSAAIALVGTSTTAPTTPLAPIDGVKFVNYSRHQRHDSRWVYVFKYEPYDSIDRLVIPRQTAMGTPTGGVSNVLSAIVPGNSAYYEAQTIWNANKSDITFRNVRTQRLPNGYVLREIEFEDFSIIVRFYAHTGGNRLVSARMNGGAAQVFLVSTLQITSTVWSYFVGLVAVPNIQMTFTVQRKWSSSTLPVHFELAGTVNGSAFLGLAARTVKYIGTGGSTNINIPGPRVSEMEWVFAYDSAGFVDTSTLPCQTWTRTTTDLSALTVGSWTNASSLGLSGVALLPDGDYSVFTN